MIDARPAARVGLALLWPIGPLAFAFTIAVLLVALPFDLGATRDRILDLLEHVLLLAAVHHRAERDALLEAVRPEDAA